MVGYQILCTRLSTNIYLYKHISFKSTISALSEITHLLQTQALLFSCFQSFFFLIITKYYSFSPIIVSTRFVSLSILSCLPCMAYGFIRVFVSTLDVITESSCKKKKKEIKKQKRKQEITGISCRALELKAFCLPVRHRATIQLTCLGAFMWESLLSY